MCLLQYQHISNELVEYLCKSRHFYKQIFQKNNLYTVNSICIEYFEHLGTIIFESIMFFFNWLFLFNNKP